METALKLINVSKKFYQGNQQIVALSDICLEIKRGEIAALVGPSGSGKTTLLQIAGLLDSATSGHVYINEIDATKANDEKRTALRRDNLGFIYQFHHLLPEFTALENIALPLLIQGKNRDLALKQASEILEMVDLTNRANHKPAELSGGQQQRIAIARALISKPSLILADEPTGNLDSVNSNKIFALLYELAKTLKVACLLVTHNIDLAEKSSRIIKIKDGFIEK